MKDIPMIKFPINLDRLALTGTLSQAESQGLHTMLCNQHGITDGDTVIADWNRRSPEALWDCDPGKCFSPYVDELTAIVAKFMEAKVAEAKDKKS